MLYNELRPRTFDHVVGQKFTVDNLRSQSKKNKYFHVYIFGGQYGSGKTTISRILAMAVNCKHKDEHGNPCGECEDCRAIMNEATIDYQEIDGASNTGVDSVRNLKENISFLPSMLTYKVIVIDEVHMLSKQAFNALLKTLEEPPEYCIFILCTTEVNSIPVTIRSRAACYNFGRIQSAEMSDYLLSVATTKQIQLDKDACALIVKASDGSMRNALSVLDQCMVISNHVSAESVMQIAGIEPTSTCFALIKAIIQKDITSVYDISNQLYHNGKDMVLVLDDVLEALGNIVQYLLRNDISFLINTEDYIGNVVETSKLYSTEDFIFISNFILEIRMNVKKDNNPSVLLTSLISITSECNQIDSLRKRVEQLENYISSHGDSVLASSSSASSPESCFEPILDNEPTETEEKEYPSTEDLHSGFEVSASVSLSSAEYGPHEQKEYLESLEEPPCPDPEELTENDVDTPSAPIEKQEEISFTRFGMNFSFSSPRQ